MRMKSFIQKILVYSPFLFFLNCGAKQTVVCSNDGQNNCSIESTSTAVDIDTVPPTFTGEILISDQSSTSATATWGQASDAVTEQAELEYRVVYALNKLPSDLAVISATSPIGITMLQDWSKNFTSTAITNLAENTTYQIAVVARDAAANIAILGPKTFVTTEKTAPTTGASITFSALKSSSVILSWGAANDLITTNPASLEYKIVKATEATSIDTAGEADIITGQDIVFDWSAPKASTSVYQATLTQAIASLTPGTTYNFAVLVKNEAGKKSLYTPAMVTTLANDAITVDSDLLPTDITANTMRIYWNEAVASQDSGQLQYKIVKANSAATIDTIENIQAVTGVDLIQNWTAVDIRGEKLVTGLLPMTTYFFAILVKDELGNIAIYSFPGNGKEFAQKLRKMGVVTPIIVATDGDFSLSDFEGAVDAVLSKDVPTAEILKNILSKLEK